MEEGRRIRLVFVIRRRYLQIDIIGSERCLGRVFITVSVGSCGMCPQYPVMSMFHVNNEASHLFTCSVQNLRVSYKYGNIHLFTPFHYI